MCQPLFTQTRLIGGHAACWQVWLTIDRSTYQAGLACARATQLQPSHVTCCHTAVVVVVGVNDFLRNAGSKPSAFLDDVVRNVTVCEQGFVQSCFIWVYFISGVQKENLEANWVLHPPIILLPFHLTAYKSIHAAGSSWWCTSWSQSFQLVALPPQTSTPNTTK